MNSENGRCAILFPHGVLFRDEEKEMRTKLIESDYIECIIGLGPNLFFNSNMEACIVICRSVKEYNRRNKILFINALKEYTHRSTETFLEDKHIKKIADAYKEYKEIDFFSRIVPIEEIKDNKYLLTIN